MMHRSQKIVFSIVTLLIGAMLAVYFKSTPEQPIRETRDMWEIRMQLQNEQNTQQYLQNELNELKSVQSQYQSASEQVQVEALRESMDRLRKKAGLVEITDPGILIQLVPIDQADDDNESIEPELTPELLSRLINELNSYGANHISIENERHTNMTGIRYVGDRIHINQRPLAELPLSVKVASDDPDRLLSYIEVSQSRDEFAMHNIQFVLERKDNIEIPAYDGKFQLQHIEIIEDDEAGVN